MEPDKSPENTEEIAQDPVVTRNFQLLESALIQDASKIKEEGMTDNEKRFPIAKGERKGKLTALRIIYNTESGGIGRPDYDNDSEVKDREYSILRTYLENIGNENKVRILLSYPENWMAPHVADAAVEGRVDHLSEEGNHILPERLNPEDVRENGIMQVGEIVPWGHSDVVGGAIGDNLLKQSIEEFNKKYGPSLEEDLFGKLGQAVVVSEE